jgi:RimJ/RimL family protein N-acetyltransferase
MEKHVRSEDGKNMTSKRNMLGQGVLMGRRIYLRPFSKGDLPHSQRWSNDPEIRKLTGEVAPMTDAEAEKFYEEARSDKDQQWYAIVLKDKNRVIGEAGLLRMFRPWRCTDMTIIIGEKDAWGKGYGTEVGHLLLDYAFNGLGFHRVSIGVVSFNVGALKFWEALGFRKEGVERDGYYCNDEFSDFVMMSILEDEFKTLHEAKAITFESTG